MNSNSKNHETNNAETPSLQIDPIAITYLKGNISFQDYESLIETHRILSNSDLSTQTVCTEVVQTSDQNAVPSFSQLKTHTSSINRQHSSHSSSSGTSSVKSYSINKIFQQKLKDDGVKQKFKDRFLNLKNILSSNEDTDETGDEDICRAKTSNDQQDTEETTSNDEEEDCIENLDETSNWNDFDIETLNFDKFIKDHRQSSNSNDEYENKKSSKTKGGSENSSLKQTSNLNKRKLDAEDSNEMKAKRRRNRVLPVEIQGLMGEANLAYARGETNKAIDVCLEVIKYAPKACEPFQLLALLYGEMGENDKALRVGLIAAQLNKDPDEWIQLIQQAVIEGDVDLVLFCYNNAIQCDPKNIQLHVERIHVLEQKKDQRRLILAKLMLLKYIDIKTDLSIYNTYFKQVMNELNNESDISKKIYVLKNDMKKFQEEFLIENLRQLIELLIKQKQFKEAITFLMNKCKITIISETTNSAAKDKLTDEAAELIDIEMFKNLNELEFEIPESCNNYIRVLFIVCLICMDYKNEQGLISYLYKFDAEDCSCEFKLIADTYYERKDYEKSRNYFHYLLTNVRDCLLQLEIWLKYGNCCNYLDEIEDAINAYRNAVNLDCSNCEAALSLVNILKRNSELFEEASCVISKTLSQKSMNNLTTEILNLKINQCFIQYEKNELEEYIANARDLLFGNLKFVLEPENVNALLRVDSKVQRAIVFHQLLEEHNYEREFNFNKINSEIQNTIFEIYLKLCKALVRLKRYDELLIHSVSATVLPLVYERMDWNKSINFTCLMACILKNDGKNAFNILKDFIIEFKNSNKLWSYVGIVIGLFPSLNQQKFFIRLGAKYMDHLPLCLINAHFAIMSGTYRYALVEYMNCFKQNPYDPFINLIISITYCHISCQKYNTNRHLLVSQSLVFLRRYIKFRGISQETYYNVARVMHQLSLFDLACHFYNKCLAIECFFKDQEDVYSLKKFAAYNLVSIYKHSGSYVLARQILKDYLTV